MILFLFSWIVRPPSLGDFLLYDAYIQLASTTVCDWKGFGKNFLHLTSFIHSAVGRRVPQGPWIMLVTTISSSQLLCSFSSFEMPGSLGSGGSSARITPSTSSTLWMSSSSAIISKMWMWGRPLFWYSITCI